MNIQQQFKTFIKKFKTNFPFRKKMIVIGSIGIVGILGIVFLAKDINLSASVLRLQSAQIIKSTGDTCVDTDGTGVYYAERGTITVNINGHIRVEQDTCNPNGTLRERFCGVPGEPGGLLRSENYVNCGYGNQCIQGACVYVNDPGNYGYGYGYNGTGGTYGYGYGYKMLDSKTNKPWLYLLVPFKTYTKAIYDAVIGKLGFQMVKSYNTKEFTAPSTK